jgi:hypothetical protein
LSGSTAGNTAISYTEVFSGRDRFCGIAEWRPSINTEIGSDRARDRTVPFIAFTRQMPLHA